MAITVTTTWNHSQVFADDNGVAWIGTQGPESSTATGGGGWGSRYPGEVNHDEPPDAVFPICASKPDPSADNAWLLGFAAPHGQSVYGHVFVTCIEES